MTHYVLGFAFDPKTWDVYLIDKKRGPPGVKDRLNGLGGRSLCKRSLWTQRTWSS